MRFLSCTLFLGLSLCSLQSLAAQIPQCPTIDEFLKAAIHGNLTVIKAYLAAGNDPNIKGRRGVTALMYAAGCGWQEIVEELLSSPNISVHEKDKHGYNAADYALFEVKTDILDLLRDHGCFADYARV